MERLSYCLDVDNVNADFAFAFARVTEDPSAEHQDHELPFFHWNVKDSDGNEIASNTNYILICRI